MHAYICGNKARYDFRGDLHWSTLIASRNLAWVLKFKVWLKSKFDVKDLGLVKHYLGLEFTQKNNEIEISQKAYTVEIPKRFGMEDSKPAVTPLEPGTKFVRSEQCSKEALQLYPFSELIGALLYLSVDTRPDSVCCELAQSILYQLWKGALDRRKENFALPSIYRWFLEKRNISWRTSLSLTLRGEPHF